MTLDGVLFLAAQTARSQAYAQALAHAGLHPEAACLVGQPGSGRPGQATEHVAAVRDLPIFLPDYGISLETTCRAICGRTECIDTRSVGDEVVRRVIDDMAPRLIIYSGFGGEIVPGDLCLRWRWMHMHSGWLPDYRGSTTIYYSMLADNSCAVSAILLAPSIDTGPIIKRKSYPPPPPGIDIDYIYDSAIRADTLVEVLSEFAQSDALPLVAEQDETEGQTYYVIHPVLKNLALALNQGDELDLSIPERLTR